MCLALLDRRMGFGLAVYALCRAILKSNCFHWHGHDADCTQNTGSYIIGFGVVQIIFSQLPNFHELWWLSVIAAVMSFSYATIAVGLALGQTLSGTAYTCKLSQPITIHSTTHFLAGTGRSHGEDDAVWLTGWSGR